MFVEEKPRCKKKAFLLAEFVWKLLKALISTVSQPIANASIYDVQEFYALDS